MKQKIPIDSIELWKALNPITAQKKYVIKLLIKKQPRWKRANLRRAWGELFRLLELLPYKRGFPEAFIHIINIHMATVQLRLLLDATKAPKRNYQTGGIITAQQNLSVGDRIIIEPSTGRVFRK